MLLNSVGYMTSKHSNISSLVRESLAQIKLKASEAKRSLEMWKQSYLDVRKRIEQSGRDARWEFDRKRLFERSDHITQICTDIHSIAQVRLELVCTLGDVVLKLCVHV